VGTFKSDFKILMIYVPRLKMGDILYNYTLRKLFIKTTYVYYFLPSSESFAFFMRLAILSRHYL